MALVSGLTVVPLWFRLTLCVCVCVVLFLIGSQPVVIRTVRWLITLSASTTITVHDDDHQGALRSTIMGNVLNHPSIQRREHQMVECRSKQRLGELLKPEVRQDDKTIFKVVP